MKRRNGENMLVNLHVKNLALIQEAELQFDQGLHILTGETGAGKSLLIGSVNLALGAKASADLVRENADYALVELIFEVKRQSLRTTLMQMDIPLEEDGTLILQRRLQGGRSISKINGETVTNSVMKSVAELLIDIHGQHEHQSLLYKKNHKGILDDYAGDRLEALLTQMSSEYKKYKEEEKQIQEETLDEKAKEREVSLLIHEVNEIENAALKLGEDELLEESFRKMTNGQKILSSMNQVYRETGYESGSGAGEAIGRALRELRSVSELDHELSELLLGLTDIDNLLNDFNRMAADYMEGCEFSEEDFRETEERLNLINHLKSKYGNTIEEIEAYYKEQCERLQKYQDYDSYMEKLQKNHEKTEQKLCKLSEEISKIRKECAKTLAEQMVQALRELNFLDVRFEIAVHQTQTLSSTGVDEVEFMISTNPGEKLKSLSEVASGGELSRIMLALKTVIADKDEIDTLIFDEIDTGISGRTAQMVAKKLSQLSASHQVICITHLAQIAAFADHHFLIEKGTEEGRTVTNIHELTENETVEELSRILGGAKITDTVRKSALEMRQLAKKS